MSAPTGAPAPRNVTKAMIRYETRAGRPVVVKDYSGRPLWVRLLFGRGSLAREARAYARLDGVDGIPELVGRDGPLALVLERVDGVPVARDPGAAPGEAYFAEASRLLDAIHARGVAIADLHRSNLLVRSDGSPAIVDFALARVARGRGRPGPLVRALMRLDRHALARIAAHATGRPEPRLGGAAGRVYAAGRGLKRVLHALGRRGRVTGASGTGASPRT